MAFMLKSSKLVYNFVGFARQRVLTSRKSRFLISGILRALNINKLNLRTTASLATQPDNLVDKELINLNKSITFKNIHEDQVRRVFDLIKDTGTISYFQALLLLRCCTEILVICSGKERIKLAEEIWQFAEKSGVSFDIKLYNTLLSVYLSNQHKFSPSEFLNNLEKAGIEPNYQTYKKLLKAYALAGDIKGASSILNAIKQLNIHLTIEDFNTLILCHCEIGDIERGFEILKIMKEKEIEPNLRSYNYLLCGYAKQGNIEKVEEYITDLQNSGVSLKENLFLDILYTLVINNHEDKMDKIFKHMNKSTVNFKYAIKIIQRLFHLKKDEAAFKIMEVINENHDDSDVKLEFAKNTLLYFASYRTPFEVLKTCSWVEKKGWISTALSYILKQIFIKEDENYCLQFLKAMKSRGIPLRWHYYWPPLIKASKKGNENMFSVINVLPKQMLGNCFDTHRNVIFHNYKFSQNWRDDYETLKNLKLSPRILNYCFFEKFIREKKIGTAEEILSSVGIPGSRINQVLVYITNNLKTIDYTKNYINLLYYLAHDAHLQFSSGDDSEENLKHSFFNTALSKVLYYLQDEEIFKTILEKMVEKKMGITPDFVCTITTQFNSEEVKNLAQKLASLNFELDDSIMRKKAESYLDNTEKARMDELTFGGNSLSVDTLWKEIESKASFDHCINVLRNLVYVKKYKEALEIAENLSNRKDLIPESGAAPMYLSFVFDLCHQSGVEISEQAFDLGVYMGILKRNHLIQFIRRTLQRGSKQDIAKAIDKYCEHVSESERLTGAIEFLRLVVLRGDEESLEKLTRTISSHFNENFFNFCLILAYISKGDMEKAHHLLNFKKNAFTEKNLYRHCSVVLEDFSYLTFMKYLEFVKDLKNFDRTPMYQFVLKKCIDEGKVAIVLKVWSEIQNDNKIDSDFLKTMEKFMAEPTLQNLKKFAETHLPKRSQKTEAEYNLPKRLGSDTEISEPKTAGERKTFEENLFSIQKLISSGNVEEVIKYVDEKSHFHTMAAYGFARDNKMKEYLEFLDHYVKSKKFKEIAFCFTPLCSKWDEEIFNKFKSLAFETFEKGDNNDALMGFFLTCHYIPGKIKEAEEIAHKYYDKIKSLTFRRLRAKFKNSLDVISENILNSEKLKSFYFNDLHLIYSVCIQNKCGLKEFDSALQYLAKAVNDGVAEKINRMTINMINDQLKLQGKSFPYPELLKPASFDKSVKPSSN